MNPTDTAYISKTRLKNSLLIPVLLLIIIWFIKFIELFFNLDFGNMGIIPRHIIGLKGIFISPLIHSDLSHLITNSTPLFILSWGLFYFYRSIAYQIFLISYLFTGLLLWLISARLGYHIGASGLVYSFATFLFLSGILRKYSRLIAISLIVVFLYGFLVWGIFPIEEKVSYEGHLSGAIVGFGLAVIYRKQGPQAPIHEWKDEGEDDEDENENEKTEEPFTNNHSLYNNNNLQ